MRTFSLLKGLPIYDLKKGAKIGIVSDLNISSNGLVKGLIIKKGVFFKKTYFLDIKEVSSFGWDGVMIDDLTKLKPQKKSADYTFETHRRLLGKMMMTQEGEKLGILNDVYFLEEMGTIVGYELSDGFFSDMLEGKRVVKTDEPPAIGKDAIIVNVKS